MRGPVDQLSSRDQLNLFSFEQYTDSFSGPELVQQWESQIGSDDWCIHLPDSRLSKDKDTNIAKKTKIISNDWWIQSSAQSFYFYCLKKLNAFRSVCKYKSVCEYKCVCEYKSVKGKKLFRGSQHRITKSQYLLVFNTL